MEQAMQQTMQQTIYALLIGINRYASSTVPDLGGCVNDVDAMATLLRTRFGVPATQIKTLLNEQATYDAVKSQFRQHLIESVRTLVEQTGTNARASAPAVLFHFSGHGSQAPDPTGQEADGFDETLVCHDSRLPNVYDLKDWELGQLLDELAAYTENITVILDCCHSGSGTRAPVKAPVNSPVKMITHTRGCFRDLRPQSDHCPPSPYQPVVAKSMIPPINRRSGKANGAVDQHHHWAKNRANHVLLAACRDQEKALEYIPTSPVHPRPHEHSAATATASTAHRRHGVLTHFLIPLLEKLDRQQPSTYRELYEELRYTVIRHYPQTPQCEGDWGRAIFGSAHPDRELWFHVIDQREGLVWINGGLVHGLAAGTRFHLFRPGARTSVDAGEVMAVLEAVEIGAVESGCMVLSQTQTIPMHARLVQVDGDCHARKELAIDVQNAMITMAIRERLAADDLADLVALVSAERDAPLRLVLIEDVLEFQDHEGVRIGDAYPLRQLNRMRRPLRAADLDPIATDLRRIVRAQRLDLLENLDSELTGGLAMTVRQLLIEPTSGTVAVGRVIANLSVSHHATANSVRASRPSLLHGEPFVVEISNRGDEPLYVALLLRSGAWRVEQIYPEMGGAQEQLLPGRTISIGLHEHSSCQLRLFHRGDATAEEVTFLLIGTVAATDFDALLQQERAAAAKEHARQTIIEQPLMRSFQLGGPATVADEWSILRLPMQVDAD